MPPRKSTGIVPVPAPPTPPHPAPAAPGAQDWPPAPPEPGLEPREPPLGSYLEIAQRTFGVDGRRFGEAMARAYTDRGWSRGELHRRSGVPESTLSAIEKGRIGDLNPITAFAIAWALEAASPYDFVRGAVPADGGDPWFDALQKEARPARPAPRRAMFARILELAGNGLPGPDPEAAPGATERRAEEARDRRARADEEADDWEPGGVRARARAKGQTAGAVAVAGGSQAAVGIVVMLGRRFGRRPAGGGRRGRPRPPASPT